MKKIVLLFLAIFAAELAYSQLADSLLRLDEVTIVSDRLGNSAGASGRDISVISAEEIERLPVNSVEELLRYVPYIEVQSRGPYGAQSDILLRGSTFNQVLVMIDGMRINDPLTGHFNSNIPLAVSDIRRIEVYRGPASAIYGPDAVGGVVNILTRTFSREQEDDRLEGKLDAWYGQHQLLRTNSGIRFVKGHWKASAGFSHNSSIGHPLGNDSTRGDFRISTGSIALSGKISENIFLGVRSALDSRLFNARHFYTTSPFDESREDVTRWWNQIRLSFRLNPNNSLDFFSGYQATRDSFLFNPMFTANIHNTSTVNQQLNHSYTPGTGFSLASGFQLIRKSIQSNDRGDHNHWQGGVYMTASNDFRDDVSLGGGLRLEYDEIYKFELLPQLHFVYSPGLWNLRIAAGRSIRSPDFTERFISTGLPGPLSPGRNLGNPDLIAERSWSLETGVKRQILSHMQLRFTGFYRFGRDLIDYVMTPSSMIPDNGNLQPGEEYFFARNIGLLNTYGIETGIFGQHSLGLSWQLDWNLTWQILYTSSDSVIVSKYLVSHSNNLVQFNLGMRSGGFSCSVNGMYKYRDPALAEQINAKLESSYFLLNLKVDQYFFENRFQLGFQVNNIFDRQYSDILGAFMPGRWIAAGITWNFSRIL